MAEVINGNFVKQGLSAADRRAIALHEWNASRGGATTSELYAEIQRLRKMIPDDSADEPSSVFGEPRGGSAT